MKLPTNDKFVYDLHALPSTLKNYHYAADVKKFRLSYETIARKHRKWLRNSEEPHHRCPATNYPITSGELAMIQLQDEELQYPTLSKKRKRLEKSHLTKKKKNEDSEDVLP
jgi:hypothetical protein